MAERSRRGKKSKLDKLAEYKRVREGGGRVWKVGIDCWRDPLLGGDDTRLYAS